MAGRRIISLLSSKYPRSFLPQESCSSGLQTATALAQRNGLILRRVQTFTKDCSGNKEGEESIGKSSLELSNGLAEVASGSEHQTSLHANVTSQLKVSPRHDVALLFTCSKCETRSMKYICRESYEKGVVVARCGGCNNLHLIADRLGWFGEPGSVEDFLASKGEEVKQGSADTINLTLEDLAGKKNVAT